MPSEMQMSPVQIAARVAVMWEERDSGDGGDLREQLLAGSHDPDLGALPAGESWKSVFEERSISLFQSVFGGYAQGHTGQGGYALVDTLLSNAVESAMHPTSPGSETLMSSIVHIISDIRSVLGDGDHIAVGRPYRAVDLTQPTTVRARLLERMPNEVGRPSIMASIERLAVEIDDVERRLEVAVTRLEVAATEIRIALGDNSPTLIESPVVFSPALPWNHDGESSEGATVATAFLDVHRDRLDRTDDRIARLEQRIRDLESRT